MEFSEFRKKTKDLGDGITLPITSTGAITLPIGITIIRIRGKLPAQLSNSFATEASVEYTLEKFLRKSSLLYYAIFKFSYIRELV